MMKPSLRDRFRPAAVPKGPLIVLGLVALLALGFWVIQWRGAAAEYAGVVDKNATYTMYCTSCKKESTLKGAALGSVKKDANGALKCLSCSQFSAAWGTAPAEAPKKADGASQMDSP